MLQSVTILNSPNELFIAAHIHPNPQSSSNSSIDYKGTPENIQYHVIPAHWVTAASQQGREWRLLPLDLIYCPVLSCYCTDLLLRPEVNCSTLGSISNRRAWDMETDTSKCWHYIISRCFSKWSLQTPLYRSLIILKQQAQMQGQHWQGMSSPHKEPGRHGSSIMTNIFPAHLLMEDHWAWGVSVVIFYLNNYSII